MLQVDRFFRLLSTTSKRIEHVQCVSTLSNGQYFTMNSFDIVIVFGNEVECCFDKVERRFDIVAGVDGALDLFVNSNKRCAAVTAETLWAFLADITPIYWPCYRPDQRMRFVFVVYHLF